MSPLVVVLKVCVCNIRSGRGPRKGIASCYMEYYYYYYYNTNTYVSMFLVFFPVLVYEFYKSRVRRIVGITSFFENP